MVNDKMVNRFMTKKQYIFPRVEVEQVLIYSALLSVSIEHPDTPLGPKSAPARHGSNTEVF